MDSIAEIITGVAWPVAAVWIAYLSRKEIRNLFRRVSSVRYNELEAQFERDLADVETKTGRMRSDQSDNWDKASLKGVLTTYEMFQRIAETSPRAAIIEYWIDLEAAVSAAAEKSGIEVTNQSSPRQLVDELVALEKVPGNVVPLFNQLRELRNKAVHLSDFNLSVLDAKIYLKSVLTLANEFRRCAVEDV